MRLLAILAPAALLAGCAADGALNSYDADLRRLSDDCVARGGVLSPTGATTGRPETDNVCRIVGATRIPGNT